MGKGNHYFARKPFELLMEEMKGENRLRRVLGPVGLTSLGVGAIIGTGIFVLTGVAAADKAGPAMMLSLVAAGITCIFAALCYAEFAAMVPVAGIGLYLCLRHARRTFRLDHRLGSRPRIRRRRITVAHGWSHYFQDFSGSSTASSRFGLKSCQRAFRLPSRPLRPGPVRSSTCPPSSSPRS